MNESDLGFEVLAVLASPKGVSLVKIDPCLDRIGTFCCAVANGAGLNACSILAARERPVLAETISLHSDLPPLTLLLVGC